jgi:hypothetical protein
MSRHSPANVIASRTANASDSVSSSPRMGPSPMTTKRAGEPCARRRAATRTKSAGFFSGDSRPA